MKRLVKTGGIDRFIMDECFCIHVRVWGLAPDFRKLYARVATQSSKLTRGIEPRHRTYPVRPRMSG